MAQAITAVATVWLITSLAFGLMTLVEGYEHYRFYASMSTMQKCSFLRAMERKFEALNVNVFGKLVGVIYFMPFIVLYLPIYGMIILITWHPTQNS